jgi:glucose-6-phosphate isomerase
MKFNPYAARTHAKMKEVLMNPKAKGPKIHYYMIRGGKKKKNITIWESGKVGKEYIKTYGHYHVGKLDETYWILQGEGILLLQKLKKNRNDQVEYVKAVFVKAGDKVYIPSGVGHLVVNTGKEWLITADNSPVAALDSAGMPGHADYSAVKKMRGFAYYIIEKNGRPAFVKNPKYRNVPKIIIKRRP